MPHCQRWHVQRGANGDQAYWQCKLCRAIIMRVGRRHDQDVTAWFDVAPCPMSGESLQDPTAHKPVKLKRSQTTTGVETPPYPWPMASATLEGLVKPGDRKPKKTEGPMRAPEKGKMTRGRPEEHEEAKQAAATVVDYLKTLIREHPELAGDVATSLSATPASSSAAPATATSEQGGAPAPEGFVVVPPTEGKPQ